MTMRTALVAIALGLAPATSALAQSYNAPAGIPAVTAPGGLEGRSGVFAASPYDDVATGSIGARRAVRSPDLSAKEGNAGLNDRAVPNYGGTSGGPAY